MILIYGLPGAGKTTLAKRFERNSGVIVLDGDKMREGLCSDLGHTDEDRLENVRRLAETAKLLEELTSREVVVSIMAPKKCFRELFREINPEATVLMVDTPLEVCKSRRPNLYDGSKKNVPGLDGVFER